MGTVAASGFISGGLAPAPAAGAPVPAGFTSSGLDDAGDAGLPGFGGVLVAGGVGLWPGLTTFTGSAIVTFRLGFFLLSLDQEAL